MGKANRSAQEVHTWRTVFIPVSTDIELADVARHEGRAKQDLMREAITCYLESRAASAER